MISIIESVLGLAVLNEIGEVTEKNLERREYNYRRAASLASNSEEKEKFRLRGERARKLAEALNAKRVFPPPIMKDRIDEYKNITKKEYPMREVKKQHQEALRQQNVAARELEQKRQEQQNRETQSKKFLDNMRQKIQQGR